MRLLPLFLVPLALSAAEGKWTPDQILKLDPAWLKKQGLAIPPSRLWDPKTGKGLLSGVVSTGGCSGSFISPEGLFITNHHCLFGIVQEHSTPSNDLITNGFLAKSREEELPGKSVRITVPYRFRDVTKQVLAAVANETDDGARYRAIERTQASMATECEKAQGHRCRVAAFDGGLQYVLVDAVELADIRLVYAPPRTVGEFGGETDNFAWPRHAGDFAIGRAYVDGKPYRNAFYFPISTRGVKPGDFVMVLGYPGTTYRSLTAVEMEERRDLFFTERAKLYGEWIDILEKSTADSREGRILVAANLKSLNNGYKNALGQLEGFRRGRLLEKQRSAEDEVVRWAEGNPKYRGAVEARNGLRAIADEQRKTWQHDYLLSVLPTGSRALFMATTLARVAMERQKPDDDRESGYQNRDLPRLRDRLEREQKNYFPGADARIFQSYAKRARAAGIAGIPEDPVKIGDLYRETGVLDPKTRIAMFDETVEQLRARHDPLLDVAFAIEKERDDLRARQDRWNGAVSRLRPIWRAAVIAHAGKPVAPDANSTLRVSIAHVKGYEPRDAVVYKPQTTLGGMVEKYTQKGDFDAPPDVLEAARQKDFGSWSDAQLGDVPVDFLADADTTGGNSGSPTVNGRGELVGVNFDRVWENVANDFGYNPSIARNVNADIRYMLWMVDRVKHGEWLLRELGIARMPQSTN